MLAMHNDKQKQNSCLTGLVFRYFILFFTDIYIIISVLDNYVYDTSFIAIKDK